MHWTMLVFFGCGNSHDYHFLIGDKECTLIGLSLWQLNPLFLLLFCFLPQAIGSHLQDLSNLLLFILVFIFPWLRIVLQVHCWFILFLLSVSLHFTWVSILSTSLHSFYFLLFYPQSFAQVFFMEEILLPPTFFLILFPFISRFLP